VDVATGEVTTITDVGDWESVAWHPSKPELAFARYWWHTYGIMATDGTVTFEHGDPYKGGCGAWWSHDDRLRVGEDGSLLLDRDGNVAPLDRPLTGCYGSIGTLAAWTSDDRYVAMLADHAIIIAEREALAYDPEDPWPCTELKPGREPVRIIFPEGEWLQGEPCPTLAPLQAQ